MATLKQKFAQEMRNYAMLSLFLILFSFALTAYRRVLAGQYPIDLTHNSYNIVESLILAKVILIGQHFKLGDRFQDYSLFIPTLYKTVIFSGFVLLFTILEHFVLGYFHGHSFSAVYQELVSHGWEVIASKISLMFFAFILLFAFLELGRVLGEDKLFHLFFRRSRLNGEAAPK